MKLLSFILGLVVLAMTGCVTPQEPRIETTALNPSLILMQLGIKGVTDVGGTNFPGYLVKTGTNGTLAATAIPSDNPVELTRTYGIYWIDSTSGEDLPGNGAINSPYQSLEYAFTDLLNAGTATNPVFRLAPGMYTNPTFDLTDVNWNQIMFQAVDPLWTHISGELRLLMTTNTYVVLRGVSMAAIEQWEWAQDVTVRLEDGANLAAFTVPAGAGWASNAVMTVEYDATITNLPPLTPLTLVRTHKANSMDYNPTYASRLVLTNPNYTIRAALDELTEQYYLPEGLSDGDMAYWDTDRWELVPAGASNEVLSGGTAPGFLDPIATFLTNYYTIAEVGTFVSQNTNALWIDTTNWVDTLFYRTNEVNILVDTEVTVVTNWVDTLFARTTEMDTAITAATNALWISTTNWTDTLFYRTNEVDALIATNINTLWVDTTNWTDTLFYRTNEVDAAIVSAINAALPLAYAYTDTATNAADIALRALLIAATNDALTLAYTYTDDAIELATNTAMTVLYAYVDDATNDLWVATTNWTTLLVAAATNDMVRWVDAPPTSFWVGSPNEIARTNIAGVPYFIWYDEVSNRWARVAGSFAW